MLQRLPKGIGVSWQSWLPKLNLAPYFMLVLNYISSFKRPLFTFCPVSVIVDLVIFIETKHINLIIILSFRNFKMKFLDEFLFH